MLKAHQSIFLSLLLHSSVCVVFRFASFPFLSLFLITPCTVAHQLLRNSGMEFENRAMLFINQNLLRVNLSRQTRFQSP